MQYSIYFLQSTEGFFEICGVCINSDISMGSEGGDSRGGGWVFIKRGLLQNLWILDAFTKHVTKDFSLSFFSLWCVKSKIHLGLSFSLCLFISFASCWSRLQRNWAHFYLFSCGYRKPLTTAPASAYLVWSSARESIVEISICWRLFTCPYKKKVQYLTWFGYLLRTLATASIVLRKKELAEINRFFSVFFFYYVHCNMECICIAITIQF